MFRLVIFALVFGTALSANEVTTDAFGIFPTEHLGDRINWAGLRETSSGTEIVQAASEPEASILFVGPKSIVAGIEPGHAVAIGLDAYGNMVSGVEARFNLGFGSTVNIETRAGLAGVLFTPPPDAGVFLAGASIGGVQSARADYRVTAHLATVQPRFASTEGSILPETFGLISTEVLADVYGNTVDDGVGVTMVLNDEEGAWTYMSSVVRDGAAQNFLLSRDIAGDIDGELALGGAASDGLRLQINELSITDVGEILIWEEEAIQAIHLRIGPMATANGYLVPDGTAGSVEIAANDGLTAQAEGWVLDGYMAFVVLLDPKGGPFAITLSLSGNVVSQQVELSRPSEQTILRGAE